MSCPSVLARWCSLGAILQSAAVAVPARTAEAAGAPALLPGETMHLGFESEDELLADFVSQSRRYRDLGKEGLRQRELAIAAGRFGKGLQIRNGWPVSKGTWNESGLDCDLIVAVMWGEWHRKPQYWGAGKFHGNRGTVAFWVKSDAFHPGVVFMQGSVAWGRKERDLFAIEVDKSRRLSAFVRDVHYEQHRVTADRPTWVDGQWQHIAVTFDRGYGLTLYYNGSRVGSTWGTDAWWDTPLPGLFSPFLPESSYDEIRFFDRPLSSEAIAGLYTHNRFESAGRAEAITPFDEKARRRLLHRYADPDRLQIPEWSAGARGLRMRQTPVEDCHDEGVSAGWVLDGRYELAWPHPYLMFTFILGDVDFHGTKVDLDLAAGAAPGYISFEGILDDLTVLAGRPNDFDDAKRILHLKDYDGSFYSQRIDLGGATALRIPLVKGYGSPPGLQGSAKLPLTGKTRIHELHLWSAKTVDAADDAKRDTVAAYLRPLEKGEGLERYGSALAKLTCSRDRTVAVSDRHRPVRGVIPVAPLSAVHLFGPDLLPDTAVDAVGLRLLFTPNAASDVLWCKIRDPANPSRIWAQTCVRVAFAHPGTPQPIHLTLDVIDLMLAGEDRLWVELMSAHGGQLLLGDADNPSVLTIQPSDNREASLAAYAKHEMLPARLQYSKEYNYRPWRWVDESMTLRRWSNFGGPFDMAYPPLAVLRHDPDNRIAQTYRALVLERPGRQGRIPATEVRKPRAAGISLHAPAWAVWERELYAFNRKAAGWIASRQRSDGMFWGGCNDDSFIPLGYAAMPLMGDETARKAWLRFYDGVEEAGIYADGYCDIWPIDPLHITDYIASRGLMMAFALGDPHVLEREMRTAERYTERTRATNTERAKKGLPPLTGDRGDVDIQASTPIQQMEAKVARYSSTHVRGYWGRPAALPAYKLKNREALARRMMNTMLACDAVTFFNRTEAMVHTDSQGAGIGRDVLIAAALGGRLQGRIEPYPPGIAVSWEGHAGEDLARLVGYADGRRLQVGLYNFGTTPAQVKMRIWRLESGVYEINIGPDADDDGIIDHAVHRRRTQALRRFSLVPITVPPRQAYVVSVKQLEATPEATALPDLAIRRSDVRVVGNGTLTVTVHNIGAAPAREVKVELLDGAGRVVAVKTIAQIETPVDDFRARRVAVEFTGLDDPSALGVRVRGAADAPEILYENNVIPAKGSGS